MRWLRVWSGPSEVSVHWVSGAKARIAFFANTGRKRGSPQCAQSLAMSDKAMFHRVSFWWLRLLVLDSCPTVRRCHNVSSGRDAHHLHCSWFLFG
jgi:hypothetical protein